MKGLFALFGLLLVVLAVSALEQEQEIEVVEAEVAHGHRAKRYAPLDPLVTPLILGKTFLLGHLLGPKIFRGGWGPRHGGWGWGGPRHGGWGWKKPTVHVHYGWGW